MTLSRNVFGRRGKAGEAADKPAPPRLFGKRLSLSERLAQSSHASFSEVISSDVIGFSAVSKSRLGAICSDLINLYRDPSRPCEQPPVRLSDDQDCLLIGDHASVRIDEGRGFYVLTVDGTPGRMTVETASEDLLLDHVICHLVRDRGGALSVSTHHLVSGLVGQTLNDIERSLILATLRHYHFNRTHAARVLGVSLRTIRNKLRDYRNQGGNDLHQNGDVFRLRSSQSLR